MSGSVEKRIAKTAERLYPEGTMDHAFCRERIARALRAERNAALEEAAGVADDEYRHELEQRGQHVAFIMEHTGASIRSLKSPAPRRAKRKATR